MTFSDLFSTSGNDFDLWRYAYIGGSQFIDRYLEKVSSKESDSEFARRKNLTFCPTDAADAIDEIKNSIFQRIVDVSRIGGSKLYTQVMSGELGGVDFDYRDMNTFMGELVLLELLVMGQVGVFVDNFTEDQLGSNQLTAGNKHPFLQVIPRENIEELVRAKTNQLIKVKFNDLVFEDTDGVVTYYTESVTSELNKKPTITQSKPITLEIDKIPFVLFETSRPMMMNVAEIQKALLNLHSNDLRMAIEGNYHVYYEFSTAREGQDEPKHMKQKKSVTAGISTGRKVSGGAPGFVSPNADNLRASMEKIASLEAKIRRQVHLNVASQNPRRQAADSKEYDDRPLEAGLSAIGQVLERGEKQIADIFALYMNDDTPTISYPQRYDLKGDAERREEAKEQSDLGMLVASDTFRRQTHKSIAERIYGHRLSSEEMATIYAEIDQADTLTVAPDVLMRAVELGLVDLVTASNGLGFDGETVVPKAQEEHAKKLAEMQKAQSIGFNANRGTDTGPAIAENQRGDQKEEIDDSDN